MAADSEKLPGLYAAWHLERLSGLRATREYRRSSRLLGPICEALEFALSQSAAPAAPVAPLDLEDRGAESDGTEVGEPFPPDDPAEADPLIARVDNVMGAWSVALDQPAPPPTESRAERLAARERAVRKRLNGKAGEAEAAARVKRVMANTAGPAMVPGRVSSPTNPETVEALREVGRDGRPASFAINLYV